MATTYICVGMVNSDPRLNPCTTPFSDGGFISVNLTGQYVFIYRAGPSNDGNFFSLSEVDIYGMTNIVGSATVLTDYSPIDPIYGANNLI